MRFVWIIFGFFSLALGTLGVFLPLLPTVPLYLLAAFCFARSSDRLHDWLITHPRFGPPIEDWRQRGAIGPSAKRWATVSVAAAFALSIFLQVRPVILIVQAAVLTCVMIFIWTRPNA